MRQLGFDETTKFQDPSMVTSVAVEPTQGAPLQVVILRAAYATGGGTSALLVKAMETKCFARLREHLRGWKAQCAKLFFALSKTPHPHCTPPRPTHWTTLPFFVN